MKNNPVKDIVDAMCYYHVSIKDLLHESKTRNLISPERADKLLRAIEEVYK